MRKKSFDNSGFTFVEVLITFSIVAILLSLTWATVSFLLAQSNDQILRTRGHFLAMEGIEIVKQIRQTAVNQNRETGFEDEFKNKEGKYIIKNQVEGFKLEAGEYEIIEMSEDPFIDYCRIIELADPSAHLKKITSTVIWSSLECQPSKNMISYSTYLGDIKK